MQSQVLQLRCHALRRILFLCVLWFISLYHLTASNKVAEQKKKLKLKKPGNSLHFAAQGFLKGREGPFYRASQFSLQPFPQVSRRHLVQMLGCRWLFHCGCRDRSGKSSFVLLQVVLKSRRTWGFALAWCQCGIFHTQKGTLNL